MGVCAGRIVVPSLLAVLLLVSGIHVRAQALPDTVRIDTGRIAGTTELGVRVFRGIPFAAPPVGALRWKPPQPAAAWDGVRACTAFGSICPQPAPLLGKKDEKESEDCLYLNVWTPARTAAEKLPVMVWIHGGSCTTGSGSMTLYHGAKLAQQGVVVVTINYRLGPFGFFAHPLLSAESPHHVSGNYGFLDQIAALQWVQRNIAAFGGDPHTVTIFGESAGSASVCRLLISPLAAGLFQRAICESGALGGNRNLRGGPASAETIGTRIAASLHCDNAADPLTALRAKTATEILAAANPLQGLFGAGTKFGWVVDGWAIPDTPKALYAAGKFAHVPLLIGTNADEGTIFTRQLAVQRVAGYQFLVRQLFRDDADAVLKLFPAVRDEEVPAAVSRLVTVAAFVAPSRALARFTSQVGCPTYVYHFTRVPPVTKKMGVGACHGLEIPYVFGNMPAGIVVEAADTQLAKRMSACWVQFAKTGNPNTTETPNWPAYTANGDRYMLFGDEVKAAAVLLREECDLFDRIKAKRQNLHIDD